MARNHGDKIIKRLFRELERLGFNVVHTRNNKFKIQPPHHIQGPTYFTHGTPKAAKAIQSDIKKLYGVEVDVEL
jgi:hypothetical protein